VVNIGSFLGDYGMANTAIYGPTKAFMRQWSDILRLELFPQKIHVSTIQPGVHMTSMVQDNKYGEVRKRMVGAAAGSVESLYAKFFDQPAEEIESIQNQIQGTPEKLKDAIEHAVLSPRPRAIYCDSFFGTTFSYLSWFLPEAIYDRLRTKFYGL